MTTEDLRKFLYEHPERTVKDFELTALQFGVTYDVIRGRLRGLKISDPEILRLYNEQKQQASVEPKDIESEEKSVEPTLPKHDIALTKARESEKDIKRKYDLLLKDHNDLSELYDVAMHVNEAQHDLEPIIPEDPEKKHEATAIVLWSDWHIGEKVELGVSMGLNKTNPDIMKVRSETLAKNTIKLVNKERQDNVIEDLLLHLGGDFINSFLHDHDIQNNYLSPIEETIFATELLTNAIKYLLEYGDFKRIVTVCNRGNHPRLTKKMSSSTDYKMSYETIIYSNLASHFANDSRIEFHIPESEIGYTQVYSKTIRYFHGHQVHYMGGVGGMTIPLNRLMMRWDFNRRADMNLMGHFHQFSMPNGTTLLNGSMVGFNSYANSLGFPYEPPLQTFQLLDKRHGFTTRMPIFCQ